jgi:hypothetical protein
LIGCVSKGNVNFVERRTCSQFDDSPTVHPGIRQSSENEQHNNNAERCVECQLNGHPSTQQHTATAFSFSNQLTCICKFKAFAIYKNLNTEKIQSTNENPKARTNPIGLEDKVFNFNDVHSHDTKPQN